MSDTAAFVIRSFSFLFPLPSALSILQILSSPPGFERISEFLEADTGQGLLSHAEGYLCPVAFLLTFVYNELVIKYGLWAIGMRVWRNWQTR